MKWQFFFIVSLLLLLFPKLVYAHMFGQASFLKVNGQYVQFYPVVSTSLSDFTLPQDSALQSFLVDQLVLFEIDAKRLPVPDDIFKKTTFNWDFNDGKTGQGSRIKHTFTKMGSYIVKVYVDDGTTPTPQLLDSVFLNILPNKDYQLPQAVITVNGTQSKDPNTDILTFSFQKEFHFDSSRSKSSSPLVSYFWDFGDGQLSTKPVATHTYAKDTKTVFPLLRVQDANGFISDSYVQIENELYFSNNPLRKLTALQTKSRIKTSTQPPYAFIISLILLIMLGAIKWFMKVRRKK